jgi:flavin-dependent dehydrogenase
MKPVTIIGGGLAGLALGIGLRERSVPTVVWEAGGYPRHRVCGEFISGHGQETLRRLGLLERVLGEGARIAKTAAFFSRQKLYFMRALPQPAPVISRYRLDALLARTFQELDGELRCGKRYDSSTDTVGIVRASGRRLQNAGPETWRWFGLKGHAHKVTLVADLEMHLTSNGYVGLCRLDDGKVNVCGLFRRKPGGAALPQSIPDRLRGEPGSLLYQRLEAAEFDQESCCAVGGLDLKPQRARDLRECSVGDALTMIPPVTGNGMSMAFESAELSLAPLTAYAQGEMDWEIARREIAQKSDAAFRSRLWCAARLQQALVHRSLARVLGRAANWEWCWRFFFWATR